ncbi:MAG: hypothetical protein KDI88_05575 [Gammaproteobacteria bacterium]|nr:hypothetical protein [Gammaproteobacteria bacterium]
MKVTIEIDATPQEMRTMMGLPNIEPMQQEIIEKIREKTLASIDANDPTQLMKFFIPTSEQFKSVESLQASFWEAMAKSMGFTAGSKDSK